MKKKSAVKTMSPREEAQAKLSGLDFFTLVKQEGGNSLGVWTEADRVNALIAQYGSLENAPKNLKLYLIGSDKDKTTAFRMKHKEAALKELAEATTKTLTKDLQETTKALEQNPEDKGLAQDVVVQRSKLEIFTATAKSYITVRTVTAAAVAILTAGAVYYNVYGSYDFLSKYAGMAYAKASAAAGYAYTKAGELAERAGLGSEGYVGSRARKLAGGAKYYGKQAVEMTGLAAASGYLSNKLGYGQAAAKDMKTANDAMKAAELNQETEMQQKKVVADVLGGQQGY